MRNRIPILISMLYAAAVVLAAMVWRDAVGVVAAVGAILVGAVWMFFRPARSEGRQRNRARDRR